MKKVAFRLVTVSISVLTALIFLSCDDNGSHQPLPVITSIYPNSGIIGTRVRIIGNNLAPPITPPASLLPTDDVVKFNGTMAEIEVFYQDSIGKQRIETQVPTGATSGKITVTANGTTVSSPDDFIITTPTYLPNVTVTTVASYGGRGIDMDTNGNFYLADAESFKVLRITPNGTSTTLFYQPGTSVSFGVAVDTNGNVYAVVDHTIVKIKTNGNVSTLAGSTMGYADGKGSNAQFNFPWGIAVDIAGNVYVADGLNHRIRKITPDGTTSTIAGSTTYGYADGAGTDAKFNFPHDIALDADGNIFVADAGNHKIRKITPAGNVTTVAGSTAGYNDGAASTAQFNYPYGIALDANGNMYVGDEGNFVIRKVTPDGNVSSIAGSIYGFVDGAGSSAKFGYTKGIVLDATGVIYVADNDNNKIRKIVIN